ncbi:PA2928 family protein [Luteimonas salinilitoris]|uniref:PA2928 family protein n=1 Tax=Luteimonas salinilitoris TaxID=3237697 RepID=A0ABV4HPE6_9GAMM
MHATTKAPPQRRPTFAAKVLAFGVLLAVGVGAYLFWSAVEPLLERDRQGDSLRITGADGDDLLFTLVLAERLPPWRNRLMEERRQHGLDLVVHDAAGARPIWSHTLVGRADGFTLRNESRLLGYDGRRLWLFTTRLAVVDLASREAPDAVAALEDANPALAGLLPTEPKYVHFDDAQGRLGFVAADGREYRVDPDTLHAEPYAPPPAPQAIGASELLRWKPPAPITIGRPGLGRPGDFWYRGLALDERRWLGLFTEHEARRETPGTWWSPLKQVHGETERRRFFLVSLHEHRNGDDDDDYKLAAIEPLPGQARDWLQGGLLREAVAARVLRLHDPDGMLILHRERIGHEGTLHLTRAGFDGVPLWTADTGLVRITQIFPDVERVLFTGAPPEPPGRQLAPEQLVTVATADGAVTRDATLTTD